MDKRSVRIKKLAMQLEAIVELDNSLGVSYYNILSGINGLNLDVNSDKEIDNVHREVSQQEINDNVAPVKVNKTKLQSVNESKGKTQKSALDAEFILEVPITGRDDKVQKIKDINRNVCSCLDCVLSQSRKNTVRSEGFTDTDIVFVASAPGREEDNSGRNFQGAAGQLIIDIIEKGMKIPSEKIYFTSIVKCRPPGNRDLLEIEIESCIKYFEEEMKIVSPKVIIAVGGAATNILTSQNVSIDMTRGVWYEYNGIPLMPIYHPSFLLRQRRKLGHVNEFVKRTWQDIKQVLAKLEQDK